MNEEKKVAVHLMTPLLGVARSGYKFVLPLAILTIALIVFGYYLIAAPLALLTIYVIYFFRDPNRKTPNIPQSLSSPADGKVSSVVEVACDRFPEGKAQRVAIFLNIFNVHVQRSPIKGIVTDVERRPGKCLNALNEKCSEENEAVTIWIESDFGPVGVRQISGAIARRIICHAEEGSKLDRGSRYGIIQFASRVELFLPLSATVKVHPGQKVTGGETCLAVLFEEEVKKGLSRENLKKIPAGAAGG